MKKEYLFVFIASLFLLSYVLEAVVDPLTVNLTTPYEFVKPDLISRYPFTTAIIIIRTLAIFLTPLLAISIVGRYYIAKAIGLLVLSGLIQLYAVQEIATGAKVLPLEWTISLALAGVTLLVPIALLFLLGLAHKTRQKLAREPQPDLNPENA